MIKLFRKIRLKLIKQGDSTHYLKYAFGEIFLLVIGILIALQLNNWNENRKQRHLEIKLYKEIYTDLELTAEEVKNDLDSHIFFLKRVDSLINHLLLEKPYKSNIPYWLISASADLQVYPKTSGYKMLNSIGLDVLSNDTIRSEISDLYELSIGRIVQQGKMQSNLPSFNEIVDPYLDLYLISPTSLLRVSQIEIAPDSLISVSRFGLQISDYQRMLKDPKLISALGRVQKFRIDKIRQHRRIKEDILETIESIDREIRRLEH